MQALRLGAEFLQRWAPALVPDGHPVQAPQCGMCCCRGNARPFWAPVTQASITLLHTQEQSDLWTWSVSLREAVEHHLPNTSSS